MKILYPVKCCFCVPLRIGLLCLGYFRLIPSLFVLVCYTWLSFTTLMRVKHPTEYIFQYSALVTAQLLEVIFTVIFILAAHKKNRKLFKIFISYSIALISVYLLVFIVASFNADMFDDIYFMVFPYFEIFGVSDLRHFARITCLLFVTIFQTYQALLAWSAIRKLTEEARSELATQQPGAVLLYTKTDTTNV